MIIIKIMINYYSNSCNSSKIIFNYCHYIIITIVIITIIYIIIIFIIELLVIILILDILITPNILFSFYIYVTLKLISAGFLVACV